MTFRKELEDLINKNGMEKGSNTPDFLLAVFLDSCLRAFDTAVKDRDRWYGVSLRPGASGGELQDAPPAITE